jgi:hypothetical protein
MVPSTLVKGLNPVEVDCCDILLLLLLVVVGRRLAEVTEVV